MIELQRLTGMRPNRVTAMRPVDIDRSQGTWIYRPARHKTEHHGIEAAGVVPGALFQTNHGIAAESPHGKRSVC